MRRLVFSLFSFLAFSCVNGNKVVDPAVSEDESGRIVLDLDEAMKRKSQLKWSNIVSSIEYVPLETSDSCLLKAPIPLDITDDYILIGDHMNPPALFDRRGRYLRRIGHRGRGPGEMQTVVERGYINPKTQEITLFLYGLRVMRFDIEGHFLGEDRLSINRFYGEGPYRSPYLPQYAHMGNDSVTFYFHFNPDSSRVFRSSTYAREKTFKRIPGMYGIYYRATPHKNYLGYNNIHYDTFYAPTFYEADEYLGYFDGQSGNYYRFYYDGNIEVPYHLAYKPKEMEVGCCIRTFGEWGDYVWIEGWLNRKWEDFLYDVKNRHLHYLGAEGIPNDMDQGIPLRFARITPDGKQMYEIFDVSFFRKQMTRFPDSRLKALVDTLPEDANGLLIYATLK